MKTTTATSIGARSEQRRFGLKQAATIYLFKAAFQNTLRPLVKHLAALGVTPNEVTLAASANSVVFGLLLISHPESRVGLMLMPVFLFGRMSLNAMDGMLAREYGQETALGICLNELGDVLSDAFLYLPFVFWPPFDPRWMATVLVLTAVTEMAGLLGVVTGGNRRYDGPMGKSDRAVVFGALALWRGLGGSVAPWAAFLFPKLMVIALIITVVNRVRNQLTGGIDG
ncbi:MAG TPA: CDP-alcohol phosphatidyltransferase family protein [Bryobacteraceae bacterium]|nr:CDP-alcohol phosphatidyltransferase family protein [Bryobacteraceae bacterium]